MITEHHKAIRSAQLMANYYNRPHWLTCDDRGIYRVVPAKTRRKPTDALTLYHPEPDYAGERAEVSR